MKKIILIFIFVVASFSAVAQVQHLDQRISRISAVLISTLNHQGVQSLIDAMAEAGIANEHISNHDFEKFMSALNSAKIVDNYSISSLGPTARIELKSMDYLPSENRVIITERYRQSADQKTDLEIARELLHEASHSLGIGNASVRDNSDYSLPFSKILLEKLNQRYGQFNNYPAFENQKLRLTCGANMSLEKALENCQKLGIFKNSEEFKLIFYKTKGGSNGFLHRPSGKIFENAEQNLIQKLDSKFNPRTHVMQELSYHCNFTKKSPLFI